MTSGMIARLVEALSRVSRRRAWTWLAIMVPAIVLLDSATGRDVTMVLPYLVATCFAAWCLGEGVGATVAILLVFNGAILKYTPLILPLDGPVASAGTVMWNTAGRSTALALIAMVVHALRVTLELERWRASTDMLTGALNKQAFHRRMAGTVAAARQRNAALVLAYLDLDGFKGVNDSHGHSAGDRVLTDFSQGVMRSIRQDDVFARIGGDEFLVLLTVPAVDDGDGVAEVLHGRLTEALHATGFAVTCSMGAIVLDSHQVGDGDSFIEMADHLMYEVKKTGKNALRVARGDLLGDALRTAFPPHDVDGMEALLTRIDNADWAMARRAAA
jgi:diguanylate cyclase (GGDEF)-like protein